MRRKWDNVMNELYTHQTDSKLAVKVARYSGLTVREDPAGGYTIIFRCPEDRTSFLEAIRREFNRQMSTNP